MPSLMIPKRIGHTRHKHHLPNFIAIERFGIFTDHLPERRNTKTFSNLIWDSCWSASNIPNGPHKNRPVKRMRWRTSGPYIT